MIPFRTTLTWLNQFDLSYLSDAVRDSVEQLNHPNLTDQDLDILLSQILSTTHKRKVWREHAEALLLCASAKEERHQYEDVQKLLNGALKLYAYHKDYHRLAVTRWLYGSVKKLLGDSQRAFVSWNLTREIFQALMERYALLDSPAYKNWYQTRLAEMNIELVCTLEEGYTWLDRFEPSHLSMPILKLNDVLQEKVKQKDLTGAFQISQDMQIISKTGNDPTEEAEVWVECALASCSLGNLQDGLKLLKLAFSSFPPYGHYQAITRWMIGIIQWDFQSERPHAIRNWQSCLQILVHLASESEHKNQLGRMNWYNEKYGFMEKALEMKIEEIK
jgi:hypothetical protein